MSQIPMNTSSIWMASAQAIINQQLLVETNSYPRDNLLTVCRLSVNLERLINYYLEENSTQITGTRSLDDGHEVLHYHVSTLPTVDSYISSSNFLAKDFHKPIEAGVGSNEAAAAFLSRKRRNSKVSGSSRCRARTSKIRQFTLRPKCIKHGVSIGPHGCNIHKLSASNNIFRKCLPTTLWCLRFTCRQQSLCGRQQSIDCVWNERARVDTLSKNLWNLFANQHQRLPNEFSHKTTVRYT